MTTRRQFLKVSAAAGGGLVVGFPFPSHPQVGNIAEINAWIVVRPDDTVIIRYARSEMGQGSMTSAAQLVAEELECDWSRVRVEYADAAAQFKRKRVWGDMGAVGSRTIRQSHEYLRGAGAAAREMLIAAAAQAWNVPAAECSAAANVITHAPSGRKTSYGRVAAAAVKLEPPKGVALKDPKHWKLAGQPVKRIDIPDIVSGRMRYGADAHLPGMAYAAIAHSPVFGGKVKSVDRAKIAGRRGVLKVLELGSFVAVVADNWWRANEALRELPIEWQAGANASQSSIELTALLRAALDDPSNAVVARSRGDLEAALKIAARSVEAEYYTPYLAHATLEPQTCTALSRDGRVDVWTSTQNAEATHAAAARVAEAPLENVYVHRMQFGGGFGRRGAQDFTRQGVAIARAMEGTPVKLLWSREEDMQHDYYRPASLVRFRAALDAAGKPLAWHVRVAAPSITATLLNLPLKDGIDAQAVAALADQPYQVTDTRVEYSQVHTPVPVGFWRGVGLSQNVFARESFIDELAQAARADPYDYRRSLLAASSKELAILDATAKAAAWRDPLPAGLHRGIAVTEARGSYTAAVAELSVSENKVRIRRLVLGIDPGHVVNPDNVVAQMQGNAAFMLSAILWGEITIKQGRVEQSNFHDYRLLRMAEMPPVEVVMAPSGGFWGGVGEAGLTAIAPAMCNAIFSASGKRVRSLPLRSEGLDLAT
jgi:isoquinoline 1-oxidoreductase subunit beta